MNIVITGATSGIGKQLALDYHQEGHTVWAVGRNREQLAALEQQGIRTGRVDLLDRQQTLQWFKTLDGIDLAIFSAGSCEYIDMPDFDSSLVSRVMRMNVETMAHSIEAVLPLLKKSASGHLAGIGSSAAYLPLPRAEAYGSAKAAVAYLLDTVRLSLEPEHIAVSLICPGFVETPLTDLNDFPMPALISVDQASRSIRKGLAKKSREIHFPKRFTLLLKLLGMVPRPLWVKLAQRLRKT